MVFPKMRNEFAVAMRSKNVALCFKIMLDLGVVKKLAVVDARHAAVFVVQRLLTVEESDDAEPARRKAESRPFEEAVLVWASMDDGVSHALEYAGGDGTLTR